MKEFLSILFIIVFQIGNAQIISRPHLLKQYSIKAEQHLDHANYDSSLFYLNKSLILANQIPDSTAQTTILRKLGQLFEIQGNYKASLTAYYKSIALSYKTGQISERAISYLGLSNVNFRTANNELSLSNSIEAAQIFKQVGDTSHFIEASALKAQVYLGLKKYIESLNIYNELLSLSIKKKDSVNIVYNMEHIGGAYAFIGKYDSALVYIKKALVLNRNLKNPIYNGIMLGNIGEVYMRKGDYQEALKNLNLSLEIEKQYQFNSGMIFLCYTLGETYSLIGNKQKAIEYFEKSHQLILETGEIREKPNLYRLLADHYVRVGNYNKAYLYADELIKINDSLQNLSNIYKIEEIKIKNDIEKTEQAYLSILNEKRLKEQELASSKRLIDLQLYVIVLVGMGFVSCFIFAFYIYRKRIELNKANNDKKLLFSVIGHDLRGPVGNMKEINEIIQSTTGEEREKFIELLDEPAKISLMLLDDLLVWSQSNDKNMGFNPVVINISELVIDVLKLVNPFSKKKNIQINSTIPDSLSAYADINHFSTILRNLLSNAIKFTPENGTIEISHSIDKKWVKIMVTDNGVGIDQQSIKKILKTGSFNTTFGTNREKGSGLGLNICKEFVKKNKGKFGIESQIGRGSTFYFTLPLYVEKP